MSDIPIPAQAISGLEVGAEVHPPAVVTPPAAVAKEPVKELVSVSGITALLLEDCVVLDFGNDFTKTVSYADFVVSLDRLVNKEEADTKGKQYFLAPGLFYMNFTKTHLEVCLYYPECTRQVKYLTHNRVSVVPNIVITHKLVKRSETNYSVIDTRYMATNKQLSELPRAFLQPGQNGLALLPFTNVYSDGRLCYGSNVRISEINLPDLRPLNWYYEVLFISPFNNDLGVPGLTNTARSTYSVADWFRMLADKAADNAKFPYEFLSGLSR